MIKRGAESIDVALRSCPLILYLFQRRIAARIAENAGGRVAAGQIRRLCFGQTKIKQSNLAIRGDFQIVRFDVAMNDLSIARVQIDERIQQLIRPGDDLVSWKRPGLLGNGLGQIDAANKLHDEKGSIIFGKVITHSRQSRMMELSQQARLLLELP